MTAAKAAPLISLLRYSRKILRYLFFFFPWPLQKEYIVHFFTRILASTDVVFKIIRNRIMPFLLENNIEGYVIVKQNII